MDDDVMALLHAVLYAIRYRHAKAVKKGLKGRELEESHENDRREIRQAVLEMMGIDDPCASCEDEENDDAEMKIPGLLN